MSGHRDRITPVVPAQVETADAYLTEMRARIRALPEVTPAGVAAIVRDTVARVSPTVLESLTWHAGVARYLPAGERETLGRVDALILAEQRRARREVAT